jgi:hypothetical protein
VRGIKKKNSARLNELHFQENHMALYTDNAQPESESSSSALLEIIYGYKKSQALFVVAKLGIADILTNDPTTTDELAKTTSVNSRSSYHLMRLLVSMGIFSAEKNDEFPLNPMRKFLLTGTFDSLRGKFWQMVLKAIRPGGIYSLV